MGAGRKTKTYTLKEKSQHALSLNSRISSRNLTKSQLGGVIFGCKHHTIKECFLKELFGLPISHYCYVKHISPGLPLFLFNYSDRTLHGVFEAASDGRLNIDPNAWTADGSECTPFAAQVRVRIRMQCQPLLEDQFGPVIADNYYEPRLFWFELDQNQTNKLISMFSSSPVAASSSLPIGTAKKSTLVKATYSSDTRQTGGGHGGLALDVAVTHIKHNTDWVSCSEGSGLAASSKDLECEKHKIAHTIPNVRQSYSSVVKNIDQSIVDSKHAHNRWSSLDTQGLGGSVGSTYNEEVVEDCMEKENVEHCHLSHMGEMRASLTHINAQEALRSSISDVDSKPIGGTVQERIFGQPAGNCIPYCPTVQGQPGSSHSQMKWSDLFENSAAPATRLDGEEIGTSNSELKLPTVDNFNSTWESSCLRPNLDGKTNSLENIDDRRQFDEQFECLKQNMEDLYLSVATEDKSCIPQSTPCESQSVAYARWETRHLETTTSEGHSSQSDRSEIETSCLSDAELLLDVKSSNFPSIVNKMLEEVNKMKINQFKQEQKIRRLEKELVESREEIKKFEKHLEASECSSFQETNNVIESEWGIDESILIVGGFDGLSFVPSLDSYCPSRDSLESLCPMSAVRSYTSAVKLNGEVYVIGGVRDNLWYDTVESYNLVSNQWVTRPSLNQRKGSLAGISLNEKIFAIGGGNGVQCFAEVEMFDPDVERWIPARSMLCKRFAPAAAEINGMVYVVGGYDGNDYLNSVERFDPREHSWERLGSMSKKRGCHSLAILNENLYAIGGYNGERMDSTVEIYDPRMGYWIMGESLNNSRGYFATAVIGNSILVIGGLNEDNEVLDTVECYKEGHGWQSTNLKAVGKRCFLSAIRV